MPFAHPGGRLGKRVWLESEEDNHLDISDDGSSDMDDPLPTPDPDWEDDLQREEEVMVMLRADFEAEVADLRTSRVFLCTCSRANISSQGQREA